MQEIKIDDAKRAQEDFDFIDYQEFWNSAQRPGYSGTAILVKNGIKVEYLPKLKWDNEGRIQALDIGKYYLVNIPGILLSISGASFVYDLLVKNVFIASLSGAILDAVFKYAISTTWIWRSK